MFSEEIEIVFEFKNQLFNNCKLSLFTDHDVKIKSSNHANNIKPVKIWKKVNKKRKEIPISLI